MSWNAETFALAGAGGVLIGASASLLYLLQGRIAGVSGIFGSALLLRPGAWRWSFVAGLVAAGLGGRLLGAPAPPALASFGAPLLAVAGLLVGLGTTLGNGCTSGHGICGLARLSPRSLVAVIVFMSVAMITVLVERHLGIVQ